MKRINFLKARFARLLQARPRPGIPIQDQFIVFNL